MEVSAHLHESSSSEGGTERGQFFGGEEGVGVAVGCQEGEGSTGRGG